MMKRGAVKRNNDMEDRVQFAIDSERKIGLREMAAWWMPRFLSGTQLKWMMLYSIDLSMQAANSRLLLSILLCLFFVKHLFAQGNAIEFDGVNDRVVVGYSSDLQISGDLTLETWVNFDGVSENHMLLSFGSAGENESDNFLYYFRFNTNKIFR